MIPFPSIDPVAFKVGPLAVHWYGLAYIAGIAAAWLLLRRHAAATGQWRTEQIDDLIFQGALGAVLGGRLGYILFYNASTYLAEPLAIFAVWRGGMSFHGGAIGLILAIAWFARREHRPFFEVSDFLMPVVPIGLCLGRLANFVNQELWGAPTTQPWGVVFSATAAGGIPRHPSQIYEALLEGVVLFVILNWLARRPRATGMISGAFLALYALFRGAVEFVREPDPQLGYLAFGWLTMGQVLSVPMFLAGVVLLLRARRAVVS